MCYTSQHSDILFRWDVSVSSAMGENWDRMTQILIPPPPPQIRLCDILTIPLIGSKSPFFPFYTLLATAVRPGKKYEIAPKLGQNNRNFLPSTLITLRASSYSPLYDIKNQDDLLKQGKQPHTNCIIKVSKIN